MRPESLENYFMSCGLKIVPIWPYYTGLPVSASFTRGGDPVVVFDVDTQLVRELRAGQDRTREVDASDPQLAELNFTSDGATLRFADFFIVTVPTPIDGARRPSSNAMFKESRLVGAALMKGDSALEVKM